MNFLGKREHAETEEEVWQHEEIEGNEEGW